MTDDEFVDRMVDSLEGVLTALMEKGLWPDGPYSDAVLLRLVRPMVESYLEHVGNLSCTPPPI